MSSVAEMDSARKGKTMTNFVQAQADAGSWKLPTDNPIWNIPDDVHSVSFEMKQGEGFHRPLISLRALAIDLDGKVYGIRTMGKPRESGYQQEGRVSIGGRNVRAFTSRKLFERADGSLCDVAVFIVSRKGLAL